MRLGKLCDSHRPILVRVWVFDAAEVLDDFLTVLPPFSGSGHLLAHRLRDETNIQFNDHAFCNCLLVEHILQAKK